jgi:hypothetical protein
MQFVHRAVGSESTLNIFVPSEEHFYVKQSQYHQTSVNLTLLCTSYLLQIQTLTIENLSTNITQLEPEASGKKKKQKTKAKWKTEKRSLSFSQISSTIFF